MSSRLCWLRETTCRRVYECSSSKHIECRIHLIVLNSGTRYKIGRLHCPLLSEVTHAPEDG
jgi:hypothetical protein